MRKMDFTYKSYEYLLRKIKDSGYKIVDYHNYTKFNKVCILRHDIDTDLKKAEYFSLLENNLGVHSTYFVMISSDFYNLYSKRNLESLEKILSLDHEIGLHFDETKYQCNNDIDKLISFIEEEVYLLGRLLGVTIKCVSMHRPSKYMIESDLEIPSVLNSYSKEFFCNFKYLSDSRMCWREDVLLTIESGNYDRLHILTHPFWYSQNSETMREKLFKLIKNAQIDRYNVLSQNIRDIKDIIKLEEIL